MPFSSSSPLGIIGAFKIFTLAEPFQDDIASQETIAGSTYVESPESERRFVTRTIAFTNQLLAWMSRER